MTSTPSPTMPMLQGRMLWRNDGYADDDVGDGEIFLFDSFLFLLLLLLLLLFVRGPLSACASRSV